MVASLPQFSVAGAVATGSHGSSGMGAGGPLHTVSGLPEAVVAMEVVGPDGSLRRIAKGEDSGFSSAVVSLGMAGVAATVSLQLIKDFDVHQVGAGQDETKTGRNQRERDRKGWRVAR